MKYRIPFQPKPKLTIKDSLQYSYSFTISITILKNYIFWISDSAATIMNSFCPDRSSPDRPKTESKIANISYTNIYVLDYV